MHFGETWKAAVKKAVCGRWRTLPFSNIHTEAQISDLTTKYCRAKNMGGSTGETHKGGCTGVACGKAGSGTS